MNDRQAIQDAAPDAPRAGIEMLELGGAVVTLNQPTQLEVVPVSETGG